VHLRWPHYAWLLVTLSLGTYLTLRWNGEQRGLFLPGRSTDGHHQIETACDLCHSAFEGVRDAACLDCHAAGLRAAQDSHAASVFADPRNAGMLEDLDARRCVTCHVEHRPELADGGGTTLARDFCFACHGDVAVERPSHEGLSFDGCVDCHAYHDNRTLREDYLAANLDQRALTTAPRVPRRAGLDPVGPALRAEELDVPPGSTPSELLVQEWLASSHAAAGVNCGACHGEAEEWQERPGTEACAGCHGFQVERFGSGRHGMRADSGLDAMRPAWARLPMGQEAAQRELGCSSCHAAHRYDTRSAAAEACLGCHVDGHSLAYAGTAHQRAWQAEAEGRAPVGSGVSCATCHLPRVLHGAGPEAAIAVLHDQSANLRPTSRMAREVCQHCHGLEFALDALSEPSRAGRCYDTPPSVRHGSADMVRRRSERSR
jgi:hypothetical protein